MPERTADLRRVVELVESLGPMPTPTWRQRRQLAKRPPAELSPDLAITG